MKLNVKIDDAAVLKMFDLQEARAKNPSPPLKIISEDMATVTDMSFRNKTDPFGKKWDLLSVNSTLAPGSDRKGDKPLQDTGRLRASFAKKHTSKSAQIGTNLKYAPTHQFGAKKGQYRQSSSLKTRKVKYVPWGDIPARKMVGISKMKLAAYNRRINNYILRGEL